MFGTEMEEEEKKRLRHDLVDFTLQLHLNKVLPLDYNPKNIFYRKTNGKYHFALIDINRLKLGKVPGIRMSMNAFSQLGIPADDFMKIIPLYAEQRGFDIEECIFFTLFSRLKWRKQRHLKISSKASFISEMSYLCTNEIRKLCKIISPSPSKKVSGSKKIS